MVDPISRQNQLLHEQRATALTRYMHPKLTGKGLEKASRRLAGELGIKELKRIHIRFHRLVPADKVRLDQMQQQGAHSSVLLQYIAATQDYDVNGRPTRDKLFSEFQKRRAEHRGQRPFEIGIRVLVPTLMVATATLAIPLGAAKLSLVWGVASATEPALAMANEIQRVLEPVVSKAIDLVAEETGGWLARAALAVGAWMGWNYASHLTPDLKTTMFDAETELLDPTMGPERQSITMHASLRAIPGPDRHLLGHLLPVELRAFLRGDDEERREILKRQPPPLLAQAKAVLATNPPGFLNFFRAARDLGDLCLPASWRRGLLRNPRLDQETKLASWRHNRSPAANPTPVPQQRKSSQNPQGNPSVRRNRFTPPTS